MKKLILLVLLLGLSATLQAEILARSPSSDPCADLIKDFIKVPAKARLEIKDGSLLHYDPSLIQKIDKLVAPEINLGNFFKTFEEKNHRAPTLKEGMLHIINSKNQVLDNYEKLIVELQGRNQNAHMNLPILIKELKKSKEKLSHFKNIDQIAHELKAAFDNQKTNIKDLDVVIEIMDRKKLLLNDDHYTFLKNKLALGNFQGEYGELMAISSANEKIIARGLTFKSEEGGIKNYSQEIAALVDKLEVDLGLKNELELVDFVKKHKNGLLRHAQEYISESPQGALNKDTIIEKIMGMVRSKEIDVVLIDSKGRYVWGEVKAYNEVISKDILMPAGHPGKKTIYDQLIEHQALADVLGLKQVRFRFISPLSIVDAEAQKLISDLGYEVVYAL